MSNHSETPAPDSPSDRLVDATDGFTTALAEFDSLEPSELGNRLARVAADYVVERQARLAGLDPSNGEHVPVDEDYVTALWDELSYTFDRAIRDHDRDVEAPGAV